MLKPMIKLNFLLIGLISLLCVTIIVSSCSGNKDENSSSLSMTKEKSGDSVWTDVSEETTSYHFQNAVLSIDYGTEWRISSKTDTSTVFTHKENPGNILLSIEWTEVQDVTAADLNSIYRNQLNIMSDEMEKLESIKIGGIDAERYISMTSGSNRESITSMHVLFTSGKYAYLVIFSAHPDDFIFCVAQANQVINTIRINSGEAN